VAIFGRGRTIMSLIECMEPDGRMCAWKEATADIAPSAPVPDRLARTLAPDRLTPLEGTASRLGHPATREH
jgi:hypothetical protein